MTTLNELRDDIHENAKSKGFYDDEDYLKNRCFGDDSLKHAFFAQKIALITSELSESLEADRKNKRADLIVFERSVCELKDENSFGNTEFTTLFQKYVKDTVEDEIADSIIRILDLCGWLEIDIERHVDLKMRYNSQRECKHGKSYYLDQL